jgi:hypothetical protein
MHYPPQSIGCGITLQESRKTINESQGTQPPNLRPEMTSFPPDQNQALGSCRRKLCPSLPKPAPTLSTEARHKAFAQHPGGQIGNRALRGSRMSAGTRQLAISSVSGSVFGAGLVSRKRWPLPALRWLVRIPPDPVALGQPATGLFDVLRPCSRFSAVPFFSQRRALKPGSVARTIKPTSVYWWSGGAVA